MVADNPPAVADIPPVAADNLLAAADNSVAGTRPAVAENRLAAVNNPVADTHPAVAWMDIRSFGIQAEYPDTAAEHRARTPNWQEDGRGTPGRAVPSRSSPAGAERMQAAGPDRRRPGAVRMEAGRPWDRSWRLETRRGHG